MPSDGNYEPQCPIYRILVRDSHAIPHTWVVSGPSRRQTWLYVHSAVPVQGRLRRPVVAYLRHVAAGLPGELIGVRGLQPWTIQPASNWAYPPLVAQEQDYGPARLHVFARVPAVVALVPSVLAFLTDALADLPATGDLATVLAA